jgi:hypothetical protein
VKLLLALAVFAAGCGASPDSSPIVPRYNQTTGRLQELRYDANRDGTIDMVSFMDGARLLRIEIDRDQDGKVERWEHYGDTRQLIRVGFSPGNDGREAAWSYADADGRITRVEIAAGDNPKAIARVEHYRDDVLVRTEEDTNGDGRHDKWSTFEDGRLAGVSFDSTFRGVADRRLTYQPDGTVVVEEDVDGDGRFVAVSRP